ncbi:MAG: hypothetical protein TECD_00783 [Hyphomicrobiaceae bacterium hypho_1]
MTDTQNVFFSEVQNEVRRDQFMKLSNKYGMVVFGGLIALSILYLTWSYFVNSHRNAVASTGAQFAEVMQLISKGKRNDAIHGFEQIANEGFGGYSQLSLLWLAAQARKDKQVDQAIAYYQRLISNLSTDPLIRDFAKLQVINLKLDVDDWSNSKKNLNDLIKNDSPWKYTALETLSLAAYRAENYEVAKKALKQLLMYEHTPKFSKQHAEVLMSILEQKMELLSSDDTPVAINQSNSNRQKIERNGEAKTK